MDQTLNQFLTSQFVKKVTKLVLLAVSLLSFFFSSYSTLWHSFFINSFGLLHFSTFSFKLLSHAMDKNCIFLICNGILVFLAKSSGFFIRFSPENELNDPLLNETGDVGKGFRSSGETTDSLLEREASVEEQEQEEQQDSSDEAEASNFNAEEKEQEEQNIAEQKREEQNVLLITTAEEEEEEEEGAVHIIEQEEDNKLGAIGFGMEEGGGGNGLVISTEELNKKCDEFIRRMHEEIRIGAQIHS